MRKTRTSLNPKPVFYMSYVIANVCWLISCPVLSREAPSNNHPRTKMTALVVGHLEGGLCEAVEEMEVL